MFGTGAVLRRGEDEEPASTRSVLGPAMGPRPGTSLPLWFALRIVVICFWEPEAGVVEEGGFGAAVTACDCSSLLRPCPLFNCLLDGPAFASRSPLPFIE